MNARTELSALRDTFRIVEGNSNVAKYFMWGAVFLWVLGGVFIFLGIGDFTTPEAKALWQFLMAVALYTFGRAHGIEVVRLAGKKE